VFALAVYEGVYEGCVCSRLWSKVSKQQPHIGAPQSLTQTFYQTAVSINESEAQLLRFEEGGVHLSHPGNQVDKSVDSRGKWCKLLGMVMVTHSMGNS
jgi:hypothetical protein